MNKLFSAVVLTLFLTTTYSKPSSFTFDMMYHCKLNSAILSMANSEMVIITAKASEAVNCSLEIRSFHQDSGLIVYVNKLTLKGTSSLHLTLSGSETKHYAISPGSAFAQRDFASRPSIDASVKLELFNNAKDYVSFEIIVTSYSERSKEGSCPVDRVFDCHHDERCVSDTLECNRFNNCGNNRDEVNCRNQKLDSPSMLLSIVIRVFLFFLVLAMARIFCLLLGCGATKSTDTYPLPENDLPPPYSSVTGLDNHSSQTALWKPETPPPSYKSAVKRGSIQKV
ncbi:hypothetical protein HDE_12069 [Halotydeus destructor]|nr:hypothetical protein HDE_12069 [Halotydeus destructor]